MASLTFDKPHGNEARRNLHGNVVVTCDLCGRQASVPANKRNDPRWPGEYCDGLGYGMRHPLKQMKGPRGKAWE
jgi:RNase P subunit RPR2